MAGDRGNQLSHRQYLDWITAMDIACETAPAFAHIIRQFQPNLHDKTQVAIRRGGNFFYHPKMPIDMIAAELIHISFHFIEHHKQRQGERDKVLWRLACDLATVEALDKQIVDAKLRWSPGTDLRDRFPPPRSGMDAEELYDWLVSLDLPKDQQEQDGHDHGDEDEMEGEGQGDGDGQGQGKGTGKGKGQPSSGQPGSGQPGDPSQGSGAGEGGEEVAPVSKADEDASSCRMEKDDYEGLDEGLGEDGQGQAREGDGQDGQGKPDSKKGPPGKEKGNHLFDFDVETARKIIWQELWRRFNRGQARQRPSFKRPSRRSDVVDPTGRTTLPSMRDRIDDVYAIIDCSGSVKKEDLDLFLEICTGKTPRVAKVALGDESVQAIGPYQWVLTQTHKGRGGTNMKKVFVEAMRRMGYPKQVLLITDGETPEWPAPNEIPTDCNLVILILNDNLNRAYYKVPAHIERRAVFLRPADLKGQNRRSFGDYGVA